MVSQKWLEIWMYETGRPVGHHILITLTCFTLTTATALLVVDAWQLGRLLLVYNLALFILTAIYRDQVYPYGELYR